MADVLGESRLSQGSDKSNRIGSLAVLRIVLSVHALCVLVQSILAGQFLSGVESPVVFHELTAWIILGLSILQVVFAVRVTGFRGAGLWFVMTSFLIFLGEGLQIGTGYGRFLSVHIPLGVLIFGTLIWQLDFVFRKRALVGDVPA